MIKPLLKSRSYYNSDSFDVIFLWFKFDEALIPLSEFREKNVTHQYEVVPDADVLDVLDTAADQKQVFCFCFCFCFNSCLYLI